MDTFKDVIEQLESEGTLEGWVSDKCEEWRNHYEANYQE
jgi:hypothetical protein